MNISEYEARNKLTVQSICHWYQNLL